jgi:hypothetical protein
LLLVGGEEEAEIVEQGLDEYSGGHQAMSFAD